MARSTSHKVEKKTPSTHWYRRQLRTRMDSPRTCKLLRICADGTYPPCLCRVQPNQCLGSFFFALMLLAGRAIHAYAFIGATRELKLRVYGMQLTFWTLIGLAGWEYRVPDLQISDCLRIAKTIGVFYNLKAPWLGLLVMGYKTWSSLSLQVILALTDVF